MKRIDRFEDEHLRQNQAIKTNLKSIRNFVPSIDWMGDLELHQAWAEWAYDNCGKEFDPLATGTHCAEFSAWLQGEE